MIHTARPIVEDLTGTLVFYLLFAATGSVAVSASIGLVVGLGQALWHQLRRQPVPGLLMIGLSLTVALGGVSLLTHSARFLLLKPIIIYACVGVSMMPRGWVTRYVPAIALDLLPSATWDRVGWGWSLLMFLTAAANAALVMSLPPRQAATILLVLATASKILLFGLQYGVLQARARAAFAQQGGSGAATRGRRG